MGLHKRWSTRKQASTRGTLPPPSRVTWEQVCHPSTSEGFNCIHYILHVTSGLGPRHYTVHLRIVLLLHFMEHLEKLMYNSYEGVSPMIFPTAPKPVRTFFRMNRVTCQEWLHRIRSNLVTIAIHAGMPALAVRNGYEALSELNLKNKVDTRFTTTHVFTMCMHSSA